MGSSHGGWLLPPPVDEAFWGVGESHPAGISLDEDENTWLPRARATVSQELRQLGDGLSCRSLGLRLHMSSEYARRGGWGPFRPVQTCRCRKFESRSTKLLMDPAITAPSKELSASVKMKVLFCIRSQPRDLRSDV